MKTIIFNIAGVAAVVVSIKKRADLFIIRLTNLKTYATLESIIIGIAN